MLLNERIKIRIYVESDNMIFFLTFFKATAMLKSVSHIFYEDLSIVSTIKWNKREEGFYNKYLYSSYSKPILLVNGS